MAVTEPGNLADVGRNGDTEETAITNAAAGSPGFPAKTQDGTLVFIVKTRYEGHKTKVLIDADGNEYVDSGPHGFLLAYSVEELPEDDDVDGHIVIADGGQMVPDIALENGLGIDVQVSGRDLTGSTEDEAQDTPPSYAA